MTRFSTLLLLLALALTAPACGVAGLGGGPSDVAQGKHYAAGNPQFDEFFVELHRLQVRFAAAPGELASSRAALAELANVPPETATAELVEKVQTWLERLAGKGVRVKLELKTSDPPTAKATASLAHSGKPSAGERAQLDSLERAAQTLFTLRAELRAAPGRLDELRLLAQQLEGQVDEAFDLGDLSKRGEVRQNLEDALKVIALMASRAKELEPPTSELVTAIEARLGTDDGSVGRVPEPPRAEAPAEAPKPPPRAARRPRPQPPAAPKPPPAEAPAETPKPPPKPAEFEP